MWSLLGPVEARAHELARPLLYCGTVRIHEQKYAYRSMGRAKELPAAKQPLTRRALWDGRAAEK